MVLKRDCVGRVYCCLRIGGLGIGVGGDGSVDALCMGNCFMSLVYNGGMGSFLLLFLVEKEELKMVKDKDRKI